MLTFFNNYPFNQLIENGHLYLAQPPLFKVTKANKSVYIKDEKGLEDHISLKIADKAMIKKLKKELQHLKNFY